MAVKEAVFPFARFPGVDLLLGPEMKSTGEVMGLDRDFAAAFVKSQLGAGTELPAAGTVFVSVRDRDKQACGRAGAAAASSWASGWRRRAARPPRSSKRPGSPSLSVKKVHEGRPHVVDMIKNGDIAMLINTTEGRQAIGDSYTLRRAALMAKLPYYTTLSGARAVVQALARVRTGALEVAPLQSYFAGLELTAPPPALLGAVSFCQPMIGSRRVMTTKIPMTPDGHARLSAELRRLKTEERPAVIKAIAAAREHGDLSENAEYHAARERQGFIEGRVMELEDKLSRAEVIDINGLSGSKIMFGARVKLVDEDTDEEASYQVVGPDEADIQSGLLSIQSPLAQAILGKEAGDSVEVTTPRGVRYFEIIEVGYN